MLHKLHVMGMNGALWDRVRGLRSETWKGCEWVELMVVLTCLRGTGIREQGCARLLARTVKDACAWGGGGGGGLLSR